MQIHRAKTGRIILVAWLVSVPLLAKKKPQPPPQTWPTSRVIAASCEAVWPVALQVLIGEGWSVKTSDRAGGLLVLEWTKGYAWGRAASGEVAAHTTAHVSKYRHQWSHLEIASASMISAPEGSGCRYSMSVIYHGEEVGEPLTVLQSNGRLEDKTLATIESKLPKR